MIVGENARSDEMDVNPIKEKKLTNMRASGSDNTERLVPPRPMSLEQALEFIADDECVEVTPHNVRLRKVVLDASIRGRSAKTLERQTRPRATRLSSAAPILFTQLRQGLHDRAAAVVVITSRQLPEGWTFTNAVFGRMRR